ncbi:MAG: TfoX/Sxy family DNA transformation protein [Fimbriimonadaceae bacterium]|nr:TfoX/Sxy family DNA transformation protein [Fimbriimonadaceae bacterium]
MPARTTPAAPDTPVEALWNLSDVTAGWLRELGIRTHAELAASDLHIVWSDLKVRHRQVTKLMFYALWGAVHDVHWNQTPPDVIDAFEAYRTTFAAKRG